MMRAMRLRRTLVLILAVLAAACAAPDREGVEQAPPVAGADGAWSEVALADLVALARDAPHEGLPDGSAAIEDLEAFARLAPADNAAAAQRDVAADAIFASLARSFAQGAADPARADPQWLIPLAPVPDIAALRDRVAMGETPSSVLLPLLPQSNDYAALRAALARAATEDETAVDQGLDRRARIVSLRASLERWRWLPRAMPLPRVEVETPQYRVRLLRQGAPASVHAAIVGAPRSPTPAFAAEIGSVTLNPYWVPPRSILAGELLPLFRRDAAAAARGGYEVLDERGASVALSDVDWSLRPFPYRVRQRPGPGNALGQVRLDLPNPYAVFLHDTPSRSLFARAERALSHGCVRVHNALELAAALLGEDEATLQRRVDGGATQTIPLAAPTSVYVLYMTAAADEDGTIVYARDIYGRNAGVLAALEAPDAALVAAPASPNRCS